MALYCLCEPSPRNVERQTAGVTEVTVTQRMKLVEMGVAQMIVERTEIVGAPVDGAEWRRHYPNVDIYECPGCGARIVRE